MKLKKAFFNILLVILTVLLGLWGFNNSRAEKFQDLINEEIGMGNLQTNLRIMLSQNESYPTQDSETVIRSLRETLDETKKHKM